MPWQWDWPRTAQSPSIANSTARTIFTRITRRTIRFPSCICRSVSNGGVEIETAAGKKTIGIHEIHMEEDAGKLVHDEWEDVSIVDYNRSGVPLIEIVSEPDMRSAEEVIAYLEKLRLIIQYLGASDCKLNEGSMRADVNLSVREVGAAGVWNTYRDEEPELLQGDCQSHRGRARTPDRTARGGEKGRPGDPPLG